MLHSRHHSFATIIISNTIKNQTHRNSLIPNDSSSVNSHKNYFNINYLLFYSINTNLQSHFHHYKEYQNRIKQ